MQLPNDNVAVGVVGAGAVANRYHLPTLSAIDYVDLAYVADASAEAATRAARDFGTSGVTTTKPADLPRSDVVLLAVPVGVRAPYIEEFGGRETPLFVEKPFARTRAEHERFLEHTDRIGCNYLRNEYATIRRLRTLVDSAVFGPLQRVAVQRGAVGGSVGVSSDSYRADTETAGGGILIERGCHTLSQLAFVLENYELRLEDADLGWAGSFDVDVDASLVAEAGGDSVPIDWQFSLRRNLEQGMRLVFEHASVEVNHPHAESPITVEPRQDSHGAGGQPMELKHPGGWARTEDQAFSLRWHRFFQDIGDADNAEHAVLDTRPIVTELIENIYEAADEPRNIG